MSFRIAPDAIQKLLLLDDATRFEPAGADPLAESQALAAANPTSLAGKGSGAAAAMDMPAACGISAKGQSKPLPCISEVTTPHGKKPVLKSMMTTACEKNCFYCPFRAGRIEMRRVTFQPDEMARTFDMLQRAELARGMFLSSGIIKGGVTRARQDHRHRRDPAARSTAIAVIFTSRSCRARSMDQIRRAMQLADRVSINLEGPDAAAAGSASRPRRITGTSS